MSDASTPALPRDAATVLLLRPRRGVAFEIYLVRRHTKARFMGGAFVFPGGIVEAGDRSLAMLERCRGRTPQEAADALHEADAHQSAGLFVAAIRETFEEAGVLLATSNHDVKALEAARTRLQDGEAFETVAADYTIEPSLGALTPQARWITPEIEPRRYDARFFLASVSDTTTATHDNRETTDGRWLSPGEAIDLAHRSEIRLPPPTMYTLQRMANYSSIESAVQDAAARKPPTVMPVFHKNDGTTLVTLPGDSLHHVSERAFEGATRFKLEGGRWWALPDKKK